MAAKRHHSSHKKHHGHHGHHSMHKMSHEGYSSHGEKYKIEARDYGMLHEDHSALANMPQNIIMKGWEGSHIYSPEPLDDTIHGVTKQMNYDGHKMRMQPAKTMF